MDIKYSRHFLNKLEDIFSESDFHLRYEKGNFKSGYCLLNDKKIAIVNKYYTLEGKINCLMDIIRQLDLDTTKFTEKNKRLYFDICKDFENNQTQLGI